MVCRKIRSMSLREFQDVIRRRRAMSAATRTLLGKPAVAPDPSVQTGSTEDSRGGRKVRGFLIAAKLLLLASGVALALAPQSCKASEQPSAKQIEFFESRIRPALVANCYECHNSSDTAEGGLAVDHRRALLAGGEGGPVIAAGKPQQSRLLPILRHEVADLEMPLGGPKLADGVIADFEAWIAMGAPDPRDEPLTEDELAAATSWETLFEQRKQWWSFQPIRHPEVPETPSVAGSIHPVDAFLLAEFDRHGLQPAGRAEPRTLVRRAFFVLIGLPPTPKEAERWSEWVTRQHGFEELIDDLLARPQFGERWARHWMDWIRYAESHGSEGDPPIENAWHYRDYLIRALNDDVPYDQLVREHVAGDLLENPRINHELEINESRIGPAHWRMVFHGFAPTDALDEKVRFTDDQINAFSKAFLGLTISCARCHDHKFDAISQRDYYALFGILGSCRPGRVVIDAEGRLARHRDELAALKPQIRAAVAADWIQAIEPWEPERLEQLARDNSDDNRPPLLHVWARTQREVASGVEFSTAWNDRVREWRESSTRRVDQPSPRASWRSDLGDADDAAQWFATGEGLRGAPHPAGAFAIAIDGQEALTGIYPAGVYSHALSTKDAARLTSRDLHLDGEYELWLRVLGDGGATVRYAVQNYPRSGTVYPVTELSPTWRWQKYDLTYWNGDSIHVELTSAMDAPLLVKNKPRSWFGIREALLLPKGEPAPETTDGEEIDWLFESMAQAPPKSLADLAAGYSAAIVQAAAAWRDEAISDAQAVFLAACLEQGFVANDLERLPVAAPLVRKYRDLENELAVPTRVPGVEETVGRDQPLFERGNHQQPSDDVPRRFIEAIDATPYDTLLSGRRQLAEDLLRDDNPFTRRVIVNRLWHHLFGRGIVPTPDNFGRLGETPSHPELLDWLAQRFADDGWSLKAAIRLMVTSSAWQRDSRPAPAATEIDPQNRLLAHAHIRRLEAEAIRDGLLAASGELSGEMYGAPVGGESNRRSIYIRVVRNALDPFLRAFDFPEPFTATGRRSVTNVPAQSLTLMNDPLVTASARAWAERILANDELSDAESRMQEMFSTALGRRADAAEIATLTDYLSDIEQTHLQILARRTELQNQLDACREEIGELIEPIRARLLEEAETSAAPLPESIPSPIALWEFEEDFRDAIGSISGTPHDGARIEGGALVVDGQGGHVVTEPLAQPLREKTLEAWVQLDQLEQQGGGVMTVQSPDGVTFDSIVFAEQSPRRWLAGSNSFRRTRPFGGGEEVDAAARPVHVAIAYHADGRIVGYREGRPYGEAYASDGPVEFPAGQATISFGVRHLPAGGNRMLAGRILRARLYDRALEDDDILASWQLGGAYITDAQVMAALPPADRERVETGRQKLAQLAAQIETLGAVPESFDELELWTEVARAMFSLKEFIYLK